MKKLSSYEQVGPRFQDLASGVGNVIQNYDNPSKVVEAVSKGEKIKMGSKRLRS